VQLRENNLDSTKASLRFNVYWNTSSFIGNFNAAIFVQCYLDAIAVTSQGFIDGVIDNLPQTVHQTAAVGGSNVHSRALANSLEAL
jgi:hypothetical protein